NVTGRGGKRGVQPLESRRERARPELHLCPDFITFLAERKRRVLHDSTMAFIRDNRPLHQFLQELVKQTGFQICIYDLSFFLNRSPKLTIPHEFRIHRSAYCTCVKSDEAALKRCMETEN